MPRSKKTNDEINKVMDVAKPGKTAPDPSGRPLIQSHQPMVKDPMMSNPKGSVSEVEQKEEVKPITSHTGITIQPFSTGSVEPDNTQAKTPSKSADEASVPEQKSDNLPIMPDSVTEEYAKAPKEEPKLETPQNPVVVDTPPVEEKDTPASSAKEPADLPKDETPPAEAPSEQESTPSENPEATGDDAAAVDAVASEAGAKKQLPGQSEEEKAKQAALENVIASKQYFVPTSRAKSRGFSHMITVALVTVLLLAVAVELAIDAGVIKTNIPPVIDLIKNNSEESNSAASKTDATFVIKNEFEYEDLDLRFKLGHKKGRDIFLERSEGSTTTSKQIETGKAYFLTMSDQINIALGSKDLKIAKTVEGEIYSFLIGSIDNDFNTAISQIEGEAANPGESHTLVIKKANDRISYLFVDAGTIYVKALINLPSDKRAPLVSVVYTFSASKEFQSGDKVEDHINKDFLDMFYEVVSSFRNL